MFFLHKALTEVENRFTGKILLQYLQHYPFPEVVKMCSVILFSKHKLQKDLCFGEQEWVCGFVSGLLCLKSGSIWRSVNMAALRWWVNEGEGFLLSRGENRREQGVFVWRADLHHYS